LCRGGSDGLNHGWFLSELDQAAFTRLNPFHRPVAAPDISTFI
jgi:hypothetical protein